jgi:CheY-like chemotaxis protein
MKKVKTIWVVDDDDIHQFFAKKAILHLQICEQVTAFHNGADAFAALTNCVQSGRPLPDVIFLDINIPLMDGWEFMDAFRRLPSEYTSSVRIFMVSSSIAVSDRERAGAYAEIDAFLTKPILPQQLADLFQY